MADAILDDLSGSGIYQIRNTINGKRYIGSSLKFSDRWSGHKCLLRKSKHHSRHLQASWDRHGEDCFLFEVIEACEVDSLIEQEQAWLERLQPEYNMLKVAGSSLGAKHSEETKTKISKRALGRKHTVPRGAEWRAKLSAASKGKKKPAHVLEALQTGRAARVYDEDARQALSDALREQYSDGRRSRVKAAKHRENIGRHFAALTDHEVRQIRHLRASGVTGKLVADKFNTTQVSVCNIHKGKTYKWVT